MKAYLQIDLDIMDAAGFMQYVEEIPELIEKHSGRYLVQGVKPLPVQSEATMPQHSVIIEFPSMEAAERFPPEREASELSELWARTTSSRILLLEGCVE